MKKDIWMFVVCCLLGGTGWIMMPYQIQDVRPEFSVGYRFLLGGLLVLSYTAVMKPNKRPKEVGSYALFLFQGILLFSLNYFLVYYAAKYMVTGLLAASVSLLIIPAFLWRFILFGKKPSLLEVGGVGVGVLGIALLFFRDLNHGLNSMALVGFGLAFGSTFLSSLGMNLSEKFMREGLDVMWATGYAMFFGGLISLAIAIAHNGGIQYSTEWSYILSLGHLAIFASALLFTLFLRLSATIGASRASYIWVITPLVSIFISNLFEGYSFYYERIVGALFIVLGGLLIKEEAIRALLRKTRGNKTKISS